MRGVRYFGFVDPSGGSSDSMTVAVAHREADRVIIDLVRERRPPFSPTDVCLEFSAALKSYGIGSVQSDKYTVASRARSRSPTCTSTFCRC